MSHKLEQILKKGEKRIIKAKKKSTATKDTLLFAEKMLSVDWDRPEEDKAWESLRGN